MIPTVRCDGDDGNDGDDDDDDDGDDDDDDDDDSLIATSMLAIGYST